MVEESLKRNIIVAMDTGSGKTHIALSRTELELERCRPDQVVIIVWFLAPTVTLCEQQVGMFKTHLPAFNACALTGNQGVDTWTDQQTWDEVLDNINIVVSTGAALLDALSHGFVKLGKLALLIFDEAHHCRGKHPYNQIMDLFYTPALRASDNACVPDILGLSASPVMKASKIGADLKQVESNLNAVTRIPKTHHSELQHFVHKPKLCLKLYEVISLTSSPPALLQAVRNLFKTYDLGSDPYIKSLLTQTQEGHDVEKKLRNAIASRKTYCLEHLKSLSNKADALYHELGLSPLLWYIARCMNNHKEADEKDDFWQEDEHAVAEKQHLRKLLATLPMNTDEVPSIEPYGLSDKVEKLVDILVSEAGSDLTCLIFVKQRAWVAALAEILSSHPRTRNLVRVGTFVGTSSGSSRRKAKLGDLAPPNRQDTLDHFRAGQINVVIATSVLEEGIDVSSCSMVLCMEAPENLKSFIQRRGRARKPKSKYYILVPSSPTSKSSYSWEVMENEMKLAYENENENAEPEDVEEESDYRYKVLSTGAILHADNALAHLHHFCATLGSDRFVDSGPEFAYTDIDGDYISAEVVLPLSVDPSVRYAKSEKVWRSERMARNDAAFHACKNLHAAGLLNDNLLPTHRGQEKEDMLAYQMRDDQAAMMEVSPRFDPWEGIATQQQSQPNVYYQTSLKVQLPRGEPLQMVLLSPTPVPAIPVLTLHWNQTRALSVESSWLPGTVLSDEELAFMRLITTRILSSIYSIQEDQPDFLWLLVPQFLHHFSWHTESLQRWCSSTEGYTAASDLLDRGERDVSGWGLVNAAAERWKKFICQGFQDAPTESSPSGDTMLQVTRAPKRRDFLRALPDVKQSNDSYTRIEVFEASQCTVSNLSAVYSLFALLFPSINHQYETFMIAHELRKTILQPLFLEDCHIPLLIRAITASSAGDNHHNYQRLEFLGDCALKYICSLHLMATHLNWPESHLSGRKGRLVSNGFLARSSKAAGLDRFIITKAFTLKHWKPRYAHHTRNQPPSADTPTLSSKTVADVIESLIGFSYITGGLPLAHTCMTTLLPTEPWTPVSSANESLSSHAPPDIPSTHIAIIESLVGHRFTKPSLLLEALTHASYNPGIPHTSMRSYERLEFLGDAVLDFIITTRLYNHTPELSHVRMHSVREALVNASFLTFRMFETVITEEITDPGTLSKQTVSKSLSSFLRHSNHLLASQRTSALKQHEAVREEVLSALETGERFPWHIFARCDPPKFLSDVVESVVGAVYVDSGGDFGVCEGFLRKLGILDMLEEILRRDLDCLHPKERLGQMAVEKKVKYVQVENEEGRGKNGYMCYVEVGDVVVGNKVEGLKRLNAETIAAWKAIGILEERTKKGGAEDDMDPDEEDMAGGVALSEEDMEKDMTGGVALSKEDMEEDMDVDG
ncbi:dicer-like protein-like protein 2 [Sporormia fimetaria CBS 119925]|uniref:Dicer-like protein-like protein 2 n=1 Tax=Sporormia fimetaria CBS 119925 TaxID=1340428 RepID=A0A6A6VI42_9PLEO|nr:dicer-like protein-like protein 2 [Sporormia fimetaria CBS 119925]